MAENFNFFGMKEHNKKDAADADFQKHYSDVTSPLSANISKAIEQFAAQRGITMVLDISKLAPAMNIRK